MYQRMLVEVISIVGETNTILKRSVNHIGKSKAVVINLICSTKSVTRIPNDNIQKV
jgi:hypothetical protein